MKSKEHQDSEKRVQESLDTLIRQTIGREPFLSFAGTGDNHVQWFHWLDSWDQQNAVKMSRGQKVEVGVDVKDSRWADNLGADIDGIKDSLQSGVKGSSAFRRGPQSSGERMHSLKIPEAVVAIAQAAAKSNDIPGWPIMPPKLQMLKCGKCPLEFCSQLNYRRHIRVHRRSFSIEKEDLRKEREQVAAFWDRLTPEDAGYIVSYKNLMLEDLSGTSVVRALANFVQQTGLSSFPRPYLKARAALLDIVQNKASKFPLHSHELLSVLDNASEKTFLCGVSSVSMHRFIFEGGAVKVGLEARNLVASLGFLVEQRLVKAWVADRDAEALRCQKALVEEEEAAQMKRAKLQERKRMKKLRQKGLKDKERKYAGCQILHAESLNNGTHASDAEGGDSSQSSPSSCALSGKELLHPESSNMDLDEFEGGAISKFETKHFGLVDEKILHASDDQLEASWTKVDSEVEASSDGCRTAAACLLDTTIDRQVSTILSGQGGIQAAEVQSLHCYERVENEKLFMEFKTCNASRFGFDQKSGWGWRERKRHDSNDFGSYQRPQYDWRLHDTNYHQNPKPYSVAGNSMQEYSGLSLSSKSSASVQNGQYHDRLSRSRPATTIGNTHVVWTRKVQQSSIYEHDKEGRLNNASRCDNAQTHDNTKEFSGENKLEEGLSEGLCTEDSHNSDIGRILGGASSGDSGTWPVLPDGPGEASSCDSPVSFDSGSCKSSVSILANVGVEDKANHDDIYMPANDAEAERQCGSNWECNEDCQVEQNSRSESLFIGSLSIPLGDFSYLNSLVKSQETLKRLSRDFDHLPGKKQKGEAATMSYEACQSLISSPEVAKESTSSEYVAGSSVCEVSKELRGECIDSHSWPVSGVKDAECSHHSGAGPEELVKQQSLPNGSNKPDTIEVWPTVGGVGEQTDTLAGGVASEIGVGSVTFGNEEALPAQFIGGVDKGGSCYNVIKQSRNSISRNAVSRLSEMKVIKGNEGKILVRGSGDISKTSLNHEAFRKNLEVDVQKGGDIVLCNLKFGGEPRVEMQAMNSESSKCDPLPDLVSAFLSQRWVDAVAAYECLSARRDETCSIDEAGQHANDPLLSSVARRHLDPNLLNENSCLSGTTED